MNLQRRWRERRLGDLDDSPIAEYYRSTAPASEWRAREFDDAPLLVLDIETTGINPSRDHLLSLGWIHIDSGRIDAGSARHAVVRLPPGSDVGDSAVLHRITDTMAGSGRRGVDVLSELLTDLAGRVLVCHFAQLEIGFLSRICRRRWGVGLRPRALIDTMQYHVDLAAREGEGIIGDDVRLYRLLERYGLPAVHAHHALSDAYGTAMLLLAMRGHGRPDLDTYLDRRSW